MKSRYRMGALKRAGKVPVGAETPEANIESRRDCKSAMRALLGRPYEETTDQPELTDHLPFTPGMAKRSPSYGKLLRALLALTKAARARRAHERPRPRG